MKSLSLHIDQFDSYIAIKDLEQPELTKIINSSNIILFKHPELFPVRLINLIEANTEFRDIKFETIEISLPDNIDYYAKPYFESKFLDYISYSSSYDGYDFDTRFADFFSKSSLGKVELKSHFNAFAKQISFIPSFRQPSILIMLHLKPTIGFVHNSGDTKILDMMFNIRDDNNGLIEVSLDDYLGDHGVYSILKQRNSIVSEMYSGRLLTVIEKIIEIAKIEAFKYKTISIVSKHKHLINYSIIKPDTEQNQVNLLQPDVNFALACCGLFPAAYFNKELEGKEDLSELILAR